MENVFVLGLDDHNADLLGRLPNADRYRFHPLLDVDVLLHGETIPVAELLDAAQRQVAGFEGPVHALIGYWDFPVSTMVPILCERLGLRWASLESVVKCEHKYWSRLEQRRVIDEVPRFGLLDLEAADPDLPDGLRYPVWIKPVKSAASELAFRVEDRRQLRDAAAEIREGIWRMGDPFQYVLDQLELPPEVAIAGGSACLVEESATGAQVTVEGYCHRGDVRVYGIVDSITCPDSPSFLRYQYPSRVPATVADRLADITRRVVGRLGLDGTTFNIEYFWDRELEAVTLLEVNPRHSQSHAELFEKVDGIAHHHCMLQLALGHAPRMPYREGPYAMAAKWFLRRVDDGVVRRVPTAEEIEGVQRDVPGCTVTVPVRPGDRLSELHRQDSYTYAIANVFVGADTEDELRDKNERVVAGLSFEFEEPGR